MNEEEFERLLNEFRMEMWKRKPTRTLSNKVSETGYREIKEAAMKYNLKIGEVLEFAGWVLTNKFQPPEHAEEPKEPEKPAPGYDLSKRISEWSREEIDAFLEDHWLQRNAEGQAVNWVPFHARWFWLKEWLIRDPEHGEAFREFLELVDEARPDFQSRDEEIFKRKTWPEVRDQLRNLMVAALKRYEKEVKKRGE